MTDDVCEFNQENYCILPSDVHCSHQGELNKCEAEVKDLVDCCDDCYYPENECRCLKGLAS